MLVIAAAFGFQVLITLYMQQVLGYHPALAGLGLASAPAQTSGYRLAFGVGVGLVLVAAAIAGGLLRPGRGRWRSVKSERLVLTDSRC